VSYLREGLVRWRSGSGASLPAIEAVYRARGDDFRRVAAAIVGDRDLALDVVQEAFARAVRSRLDFRAEGSLEGWLWRTVVRTASNANRDRPRDLPEAPAANVNGSAHDAAAQVRVAIASLPERQRIALFLRFYADLDYRAIAEALGVSEGTVGSTLHAARTGLKKLLEEAHA
jgi:RNA polymerase sigma factor (sigma-70 family)